jgi:hypothetical protein
LNGQAAQSFHQSAANAPLADDLVDVASILELMQSSSLSEATQDEVMAQISQYLFDINQVDMNVYR